jgi:hypothetical protein
VPFVAFDDNSRQNLEALVAALQEGGVAAFIGAGLSAPPIPAWSGLHQLMQTAAGVTPPRPFEPDVAPSDFMDFRDLITPDEFLSVLKREYGRPVADVPAPYKLLDQIDGIECLLTTNYDEFLASTAMLYDPRAQISIYRTALRRTARYVYLHGRAKTAAGAEDLVVCEDDYAKAYEGTNQPGIILNYYLMAPILFVGCSMKDPDILQILKRWSRLRYTQALRPGPEPFAILAAKPDMASPGESLEVAVARETRRLRTQYGIRTIWYEWDEQHTKLRSLLEELRFMVRPRPLAPWFLAQIADIEALARLTDPSADDQARVIDMIRTVPEAARMFFRSATSPAWADALRDAGLLTAVAEPHVGPDGSVTALPWTAAPYIQRIADVRPDIILTVIKELQHTTNWHVHSALSDSLMRVPDSTILDALPVLIEWMDGPYRLSEYIGHDLVSLIEVLTTRGSYNVAMSVLSAITNVREGQRTSSVQLIIEDYEQDRLKQPLARLIDSAPEAAYRLLHERLRTALEIRAARRRTPSFWWRAAIEEHRENNIGMEVTLNFLLNGTRDALTAWVEQTPGMVSGEISRLLTTDDVDRRLGLYICHRIPELISENSELIIVEDSFFDRTSFHEIMVILRDRFSFLPDSSRDLVHRLVAQGPPVADSESPQDHEQSVDRWRYYSLAAIPEDFHTEDEPGWFAALLRRWPQPDDSFVLVFKPVVTWGSPDDDVDLRVARSAGMPVLIQKLRQIEDSWQGLTDLVKEDPDGMLALAPILERNDIGRAWPYLEAYVQLAKDNVSFSWGPLIDLADRTVVETRSDDDSAEWAVTSMLRGGSGYRLSGVPDGLLGRSVAISVRVLTNRFRPLEEHANSEGDLTSHQLNAPAGRAADTILICLWRELVARNGNLGQFPDEIGRILDSAVRDGWGGLELRHALGQFAWVVDRSVPGWISGQLATLYPSGEDEACLGARRAFLAGYLYSGHLADDLMQVLVPMYQDAIADSGREVPQLLGDRMLVTRLMEHIVIGWLKDVRGFGFDGLLGDLVDTATDDNLAQIAWYLWKEYGDADVEFRAQLWPKMDEYWTRRTEALRTLGATERSRELTRLAEWADRVERPLAEMEERLRVSIDHLDRHATMESLLETLAARGADEWEPASRLLERLVDRWAGVTDVY